MIARLCKPNTKALSKISLLNFSSQLVGSTPSAHSLSNPIINTTQITRQKTTSTTNLTSNRSRMKIIWRKFFLIDPRKIQLQTTTMLTWGHRAGFSSSSLKDSIIIKEALLINSNSRISSNSIKMETTNSSRSKCRFVIKTPQVTHTKQLLVSVPSQLNPN